MWYLEVSAIALPERKDKTLEDELSNLREFRVDDGNNSCINMSKDGRRCLSLQHRTSQQTPDGKRNCQVRCEQYLSCPGWLLGIARQVGQQGTSLMTKVTNNKCQVCVCVRLLLITSP